MRKFYFGLLHILATYLCIGCALLLNNAQNIHTLPKKHVLIWSKDTFTRKASKYYIIDGSAILWIIHWLNKGTVQDYANNFVSYIPLEQAKVMFI